MKISMRVLFVFSGLIFFYFVLVFSSEQYLRNATYSSEKDFTNSIRLKYLQQQIDILNKGGYFQISPEASLIRQRAALDDVGIHVGLADLAFFQKIIHSKYRFTLLDYFYLQYIMLGIALVLVFLPIVPLRISIAALLSLLLAQVTGKIEWEAHIYWPAPVSVILAFVLLFSVSYRCRERKTRWRDVLQMLGIAIFIGILGLCRGDAKVIGLIPCLTLTGVLGIAIGTLCCIKETRILFLSSFRSASTFAARVAVIWRIYAFRLLIVTFSILFLSSLIVRVSFFLNLSFFERIEERSPLPQNTKGHLFWEPLLIGIGATYNTSRAMQTWNHENVIWGDENAFGRAWTTDPDNPLLQLPTSDYGPLASAMKTLYLDLLSQNPLDAFTSYYLKAAALLKYSGIWLLVSLAVFLYLMLQATYNPQAFFSAFVVQLSFLSLFAVTMAPAILITAYSNGCMLSSSEPPFLSYINSYWTILLAYPIFMVSFQSLLPSYSQFSDLFCSEKGLYKTLSNRILLSLTVAFFFGFLSIAAWFGYKQHTVVRLRNNLTESRESSVTFLKNAYHADIVRAINGLPEKERNTALEFIGKAEWGIPISLSAFPNASSDLIVKGAKWVEDDLFLIVQTRTQLKGAKIVPLNVHNTAKGGNAIVLLPQNLKAGNWLFSVTVGSKSNRVTVYEPVTYSAFQYLQPPASPPLVSVINLSLSDQILKQIENTQSLLDLHLLRQITGDVKAVAELQQASQRKETLFLAQQSPCHALLVKGVELVDFRWKRLSPVSAQSGFEGTFLLRITEDPNLTQSQDFSIPLTFTADEKDKGALEKANLKFPSFGFSLAKLPVQSWKKGDYYLAKRAYAVPDVPYRLKMGLAGDGKLISPWVDLGQYPASPVP